MRNSGTLLLCVLMCVFLLLAQGCQSSDNLLDSDEDKPTNRLGDYEVDIVDYQKDTNIFGKAVITIKYKFTNHSEQATSFMLAINDKVFQNGVALTSGLYDMDKNAMTEIQPGISIDVQINYELNDMETDIEIELTESSFRADPDEKITKKIKIKRL